MIQTLRRNFSIFWLFSRYALKTTFQQRSAVIFFILGKALRFGLFFFFVIHLLQNTKLLAGYSLEQTIVFFMTFNIIDSVTQMLYREVYRFRPLVVRGELDAILVKPYHPFMRILLGGVDVLDVFMLVPYIGILLWYLWGTHLEAVNIIAYFVLLGGSLLISTAFHICVLALGVITTEVDHTIMIYRDLTRLGTLPIDIYREPIRSMFTFVIPIGMMMSFPPKALFGLLSMPFILLTIGVSVLSVLLSVMFWNKALTAYQSGSS